MKKFLGTLNVVALAVLVAMFLWLFWPQPDSASDSKPDFSAKQVTEGPEKVVRDVFRSLGAGKVDSSNIEYANGRKPMQGIRVTVDPHGRKHAFHGLVKFPLTEMKVSAYDPKTGSAKYSVRVPHPCVMFWQWDTVYPDELTRVPPGLRMEGSLALKRAPDGAWQVVVDTETNPIALYHKVYGSVNQMWFMASSAGRISPERLRFNMLMLFSAYSIALDIPDDQLEMFAKQAMDECDSVLPKKNARK